MEGPLWPLFCACLKWCYNTENPYRELSMKYRVAKPLRYFHIGSVMDIDPEKPFYARLIADGTLEPVEKKPKASKREKKVTEPTEAKADDGQDE